MATVRQIEFALFDFKLHQKLYKTEFEIQELLNSIRDKFSVIKHQSIISFKIVFSYLFRWI